MVQHLLGQIMGSDKPEGDGQNTDAYKAEKGKSFREAESLRRTRS